MSTSPSFAKGVAASKSEQKSFDKTHFFSIENGESVVVRFLTDMDPVEGPSGDLAGGLVTVFQHQNVPTLGKPADSKATKWPTHMAAPCRRDPAFVGMYDECYICDVIMKQDSKVKRGKRSWALAVLREEVKEDARVVGYRTKKRKFTRKVDDKEVEVEEPAIVICNMADRNFFTPLGGFYSVYGTILDRDYHIRRSGESTETTYQIVGLDPVPASEGGTLDLRNDEMMAKFLPKAAEIGYAAASDDKLYPIIEERTNDDFYGTFFDPTKRGGGTESAAAPTAQAPATDADASPEALAALRDRVRGFPSPAAEGEPELATAGTVRNFD